MDLDLSKALLFAKFSQHAYPEHSTGIPKGWTHVKSFHNASTDARALIAVKENVITVAAKGTSSWMDILQDAKFELVDVTFGKNTVRMEKGFWEDCSALKDGVAEEVQVLVGRLKEPKVIVTGHSLGGAIASGFVLDLGARGIQADAWTFGSPKPGDASFEKLFDKVVGESCRIVHERDLIPGLPKRWGYSHVDTFFHIDDEGRRVPTVRTFWKHLRQFLGILKAEFDGEGLRDHFIKNYVKSLERGIASVP